MTGLDLVEWQIRVADGEKLPLGQDSIHATGSAIEARINAEDPAAGYRPALGEISLFEFPPQDGVRVDTGVKSGGTVTPYYDSLLAKIIAFGPDRNAAVARLSGALGNLAVLGIKSSQAFLRDIVDHPTFRAGQLTTRFIGETFPDGWTAPKTEPDDFAAAAAVWAIGREVYRAPSGLGPWASLGGFRLSAAVGPAGWVALEIATATETLTAEISGLNGKYLLRRDSELTRMEIRVSANRAAIKLGDIIGDYSFVSGKDKISLGRNGKATDFSVIPRIETAGGKGQAEIAGAGRIAAPMPGLISQLNVAVGQSVGIGDTVIVLEAMKLMYSLPAQISGRVSEVFCAVGDTVPAGSPLVEITSDA
jgi:acetyl/propionyl-CoA carboxylase alpha subunit